MNSDFILEFVYGFFKRGIKIWLQNENLKVFVPQDVTLLVEDTNFIKLNRDKIFDYLHENKIFSKEFGLSILRSPLPKANLSFAQERLWFIEQYEEGTNAYNVPMVFRLS